MRTDRNPRQFFEEQAQRQRPLPKDTHNRLDSLLRSCKNLGLLLDKYQPWQDGKLKVSYVGRKGRGEATESEAKGYWLTGARQSDPSLMPNTHIDEKLVGSFRERWEAMVSTCAASQWIARTAAPLIVGLGAENTLETSLTLHACYGFPYIPGSAVKGLARAAAFYEVAEQLNIWGIPAASGERTALQDLEALLEIGTPARLAALMRHPEVRTQGGALLSMTMTDLDARKDVQAFRRIFGTRRKAGSVVFFDAVPNEKPTIIVEIMNPHFPDYYQKKAPPADDQQPKPVTFLAVKAETSFHFAVAARRLATTEDRDRAKDWLKKGLVELGLGAKTAAGYGVFHAT